MTIAAIRVIGGDLRLIALRWGWMIASAYMIGRHPIPHVRTTCVDTKENQGQKVK